MSRRSILYSVLVVLLTVYCVAYLFIVYRPSTKISYTGQDYNVSDLDEREYLGFIFDDYNKNVSLGYRDTVPSDVSQSSAVHDTLSTGNGYNSSDNADSRRSEGIMNSLSQSSAGNQSMDAYNINSYSSITDSDDKVEIIDLMGKLEGSDMVKIKRLFDRGITKPEIDNILNALKDKLSCEELNWLSNCVKKYGLE